MQMKFDMSKEEWKESAKAPWIREWWNNRSSIPSRSSYSNIDWKLADPKKFLELCYPRTIGAINNVEATQILYSISTIVPKSIVEIGRMGGGSTLLFGTIAKKHDGKLYSIDGDKRNFNEKILSDLSLNENVELIYRWSPWVNWEKEIDFLFIDGDHSFISVLMDYHYFNFFVKKDGFIAFHDINLKEVTDAIELIRKRDPLEEIKWEVQGSRLKIFRKLSDSSEKYFELLSRNVKREQLHEL